jgi:hypothetical protein
MELLTDHSAQPQKRVTHFNQIISMMITVSTYIASAGPL